MQTRPRKVSRGEEAGRALRGAVGSGTVLGSRAGRVPGAAGLRSAVPPPARSRAGMLTDPAAVPHLGKRSARTNSLNAFVSPVCDYTAKPSVKYMVVPQQTA